MASFPAAAPFSPNGTAAQRAHLDGRATSSSISNGNLATASFPPSFIQATERAARRSSSSEWPYISVRPSDDCLLSGGASAGGGQRAGMSRGNAAVTQIPNFLFNYRRARRLSFLTAAQIHQTPSLLLEGRCRSLGLARSQTTGLWLRANHPALSAVTWDFFLRWALDAFLPFPELNLSHRPPKMVRYAASLCLSVT